MMLSYINVEKNHVVLYQRVRPIIDTYKTAKKSFWHVNGLGYNTQFLLHTQPLTCQKFFLLFYMCLLWALHVVINGSSYIYICIFLLNLFYRCILLHKPIYGVAKTKESHCGILHLVSIW